jgi:hypothetical protein
MTVNKFLIEGLDRLGKDTLISGIQHARGFHQVIHYSKPLELRCYEPCPTGMTAAEMKQVSLLQYQTNSFRTMFSLLRDAVYAPLIMNRAHLGERVYAPLYRGYSGDYVFNLEVNFGMRENRSVRLILLTEDFRTSKHFSSDGESFDDDKRQIEQELFQDVQHELHPGQACDLRDRQEHRAIP